MMYRYTPIKKSATPKFIEYKTNDEIDFLLDIMYLYDVPQRFPKSATRAMYQITIPRNGVSIRWSHDEISLTGAKH
jgi:hypothetical protein